MSPIIDLLQPSALLPGIGAELSSLMAKGSRISATVTRQTPGAASSGELLDPDAEVLAGGAGTVSWPSVKRPGV